MQKYSQKDEAYIREQYVKGASINRLAYEFAMDKTKADSQKPRIRQILQKQGVRIRSRNERPLTKTQNSALAKAVLELAEKSKELDKVLAEVKKSQKNLESLVKRAKDQDRTVQVSLPASP